MMEHKQVARTLEVLGWIIIAAAVFAGFKLADIHTVTTDDLGLTSASDTFSWITAFEIWFGGAIFGFSLIGFSSIIQLLIKLTDRKSEEQEKTEETPEEKPGEKPEDKSEDDPEENKL